jgi:hypothetical protein
MERVWSPVWYRSAPDGVVRPKRLFVDRRRAFRNETPRRASFGSVRILVPPLCLLRVSVARYKSERETTLGP